MLAREYQQGQTTVQLQRKYDLGKGSVLAILQAAGVEMRHQSLDDNQVRRCVELYAEGRSIRGVAAQLGVPKTTVQDALRETGVRMRAAVRYRGPGGKAPEGSD
jgi:hypothetical protein